MSATDAEKIKVLRIARGWMVHCSTPAPSISRGICNALFLALVRSDCSGAAYEELKAHISRCLGGDQTYLSDWLVRNGHAVPSDIDSPEGRWKLYRTRIAWIDHMIAQLKGKA